jgi:hypothetical protein
VIEGVINLLVKNSTLLRDADVLTKMDPLCEVEITGLPTTYTHSKLKYVTETHQSAGKNPVWN